MKIIYINQSDIDGGAARAAHRVASKLVEMDVDLKMQVMRKLGKDEWVIGPRNIFLLVVSRLLPRLDLIAKRIMGVNPRYPWSLNLIPNFLLSKNFVNSFDVIHLHWVGKNMLPVNWIPNFKTPVVWTLHDGWAFTGGCHYPTECRRFEQNCGQCPQLSKNNQNDMSNRIWLNKSVAYKEAPFHFVAPSHWIAEEARASSLLKDFPVTVIPNGLDTSVFRPYDKTESREFLGVSGDKRIILFGAMYADTDRRKGMDLLIEAMNILVKNDANFAKQNLLVIFGTGNEFLSEIFPLPVVCLGMISNVNKLARIYSAADVTVVPSRSESFGQVASESLSCGTPVVAFNTTGLKDVIDHMESGYLANDYKTEDLACGIKLIIENTDTRRQMSSVARQQALERFDINVTARMHLDIYRKLSKA
jgi:glycosyltransferase involved in cell wall biosynthesis